MPKIVEYPRTNFQKCLHIAEIVYQLGGKCSFEECASQMNKSVSGVFITAIGSAVKYDLLQSSKNQIIKTNKLDYIFNHKTLDPIKHQDGLLVSFLSPKPYLELYKQFNGEKLNIDALPFFFSSQYNADKKFAGRISKYFIEGLKFLKLINQELVLKELKLNRILELTNEISEKRKSPLKEDQLPNQLDLFLEEDPVPVPTLIIPEEKLEETMYSPVQEKEGKSPSQAKKVKKKKERSNVSPTLSTEKNTPHPLSINISVEHENLSLQMKINKKDDFNFLQELINHLRKESSN